MTDFTPARLAELRRALKPDSVGEDKDEDEEEGERIDGA